MTTLRAIVAAARAGELSLVGETAGYLVLGAADAALSGPVRASLDCVQVTLDGNVVVERAPGDSARSELELRTLLGQLLGAVRIPTPNLALVAQTDELLGLPSLVRELEAALVPVNRKAAKRALSRLARDAERAFERNPNFSSLLVEDAPPMRYHTDFAPPLDQAATPELTGKLAAPAPPLEGVGFDVEMDFEDFESAGPLAVVESKDERYLTEEGVLETMLSMRPAHRDTSWADEDDFLTELWAARSVRPPVALGVPAPDIQVFEETAASLGTPERERALPTVPASAPAGLDSSAPGEALQKMQFDAQTMVPMPVVARAVESVAAPRPSAPLATLTPPLTDATIAPAPAEATIPAPRRSLADFDSPEPPVLGRPAPARPLGPFELPEEDVESAPRVRKHAPAAGLAPIVLRVETATATAPSGPLLELDDPAPRRRSDIAALLAGRAIDARPPAELLATLQTLSGLGAPRVPAELASLSEASRPQR